jgi:hypothetical protein
MKGMREAGEDELEEPEEEQEAFGHEEPPVDVQYKEGSQEDEAIESEADDDGKPNQDAQNDEAAESME